MAFEIKGASWQIGQNKDSSSGGNQVNSNYKLQVIGH